MHQMRLTNEVLLQAYRMGMFPMAVPEMHNELFWFAPDPRAVLPLDAFHVSKSLRRTVRQQPFEIRLDRNFEAVMRACAEPRKADGEIWISEEIIHAYTDLHKAGSAHSIECYRENELVGGLYGVSVNGAFFGESMFHRARDASKVALVHLVRHLRDRGFELLDVQYQTPHLQRFGVVEISRPEYERRLAEAVALSVHW